VRFRFGCQKKVGKRFEKGAFGNTPQNAPFVQAHLETHLFTHLFGHQPQPQTASSEKLVIACVSCLGLARQAIQGAPQALLRVLVFRLYQTKNTYSLHLIDSPH
jgi:hypothetical protein